MNTQLSANEIITILNSLKNILWDGPLLFLLLGVSIYQTIRLGWLQFRKLFTCFIVLKNKFNNQIQGPDNKIKGDISSFQSLMTSLAGSIGTGNITGVAIALATGGVGALFWMWVMAFFGMATAYSETLLGVKFRQENENNEMSGGPMYTLLNGMKSKKLGIVYAILLSLAAIGIGCMAQSNSVVEAISQVVPYSRLSLGIGLCVLTGAVIIGGVKSIGKVSGVLVPVMGIAYISASILIIILNITNLPQSFLLIIKSAFTGQAAVGGFLGSTILLAMQNGVQYGIFANEAGWGTLSIAGSSAQISEPAEQGMLAISGVFLATMVVCTLTGLVLTITNSVGSEVNGVLVSGSSLAMHAYSKDLFFIKYIVVISLSLFAFTTMIAWAYYGEKCFEFLFGIKWTKLYRWLFTSAVILGSVMKLDLVWSIANLLGGLMTIPNLISIVVLSKIVQQETRRYFNKR